MTRSGVTYSSLIGVGVLLSAVQYLVYTCMCRGMDVGTFEYVVYLSRFLFRVDVSSCNAALL